MKAGSRQFLRGTVYLMKDRGFRRCMQFNIKEREYEHVLTASSVCIDTSFLFSFLKRL